MENLVEDFLQHIRHEKGQSPLTEKTYAHLMGNFLRWASQAGLKEWREVELRHLTEFLASERQRQVRAPGARSQRGLTSESLYLQIAALRAFYRFAESEGYLTKNVAENLSLPRRWQRLPKGLSGDEIERLLEPVLPETPESLCDQAILELAYSSGLRLAELCHLRLEQLHLEAGF